MGYRHSLDLRRRIIEAVSAGNSARGAVRRFAVSASIAILPCRWVARDGQLCAGENFVVYVT